MPNPIKAKQKILNLLEENPEMTPHQLTVQMQMTRGTIHSNLKLLLQQKKIKKVGKSAIVFYSLVRQSDHIEEAPVAENNIAPKNKGSIDENFVYVTERGVELYGNTAFCHWASINKPGKNLSVLAQNWIDIRKKTLKQINKDGYLDMTAAIDKNFNYDGMLDKVFASDYYTLPNDMGMTMLGTQVHYAKANEVSRLMFSIAEKIKPVIDKIIANYKVTMVGYAPHTRRRGVQFMTRLKTLWDISFQKELTIIKSYLSEIRIEHKALKTLSERIKSAEIILLTNFPSSKDDDVILLIDDTIGTGATVHEIAKQIKLINPNVKVIAYGIVGNPDGRFEVEQSVSAVSS